MGEENRFPDPVKFIATLRKYLAIKKANRLSDLLLGATCTLYTNGEYSPKGWHVEYAFVDYKVQVEKFTEFEQSDKENLLIYTQEIFPENIGYDLLNIFVTANFDSLSDNNIQANHSKTIAFKQTLFRPVWGEPSIDDQYKCDVFMIMPFRPELDDVYKEIIKPTVEALGLSILRGDDPFTSKDIMYDVWSMLSACRLVIADCSGRNANVFYELGIAHTIGKPVIMLSQNLADTPFDVVAKRVIEYGVNFKQIEKLKSDLKKSLSSILMLA